MTVRDLFEITFGGAPTYVARAPGRINLIGEHTDYQGGFVFPLAIDREVMVAVRPALGETRLQSLLTGTGKSFDAPTVEPGDVKGWARYVASLAWAFRQKGHPVPNFDAAVVSAVPMGSGVSSSAGIQLSFAVVMNEMTGAGFDPQELALLAQYAENEFIGNKCGIMDQTASARGVEGHALFLDTRSLEISPAPLPPNAVVALLDTKTPRGADDWQHYNARRASCERAALAMGVEMLRDVGPEDVERAAWMMGPETTRRARHVTSENARCLRFKAALDAGDEAWLGILMRASHESLRDDYEVSCPELDAMAEAAWGAPGCIGARLTGAGFGGACVALVHEDELEAFTQATLEGFQRRTGKIGDVIPTRAAGGAELLPSDVER